MSPDVLSAALDRFREIKESLHGGGKGFEPHLVNAGDLIIEAMTDTEQRLREAEHQNLLQLAEMNRLRGIIVAVSIGLLKNAPDIDALREIVCLASESRV